MRYKKFIAIINIMIYDFECILHFFYIRLELLFHKKRKILLGTPWYGNLGDQAIVLGEVYILSTVFPDYHIVNIPAPVYLSGISKKIGLGILKSDVLYLNGGGNLGTLYINEENIRRTILKDFKENKIVIMPVSIYFDNNGTYELNISASLYNGHKDLSIISRDENSYAFAVKNFNKVNNILAPDAVTALDGILSEEKVQRRGILFLLRQDKEKNISSLLIEKIIDYLKSNDIYYEVSDTFVKHNIYGSDCKREVFNRLRMAKKARLVITDRYHGLLFSVITKTPVIVFKSFDTKISSGIKWFNKLDYVHYVEGKDVTYIKKIIDIYCEEKEVVVKGDNSDCKNLIIDAIRNI